MLFTLYVRRNGAQNCTSQLPADTWQANYKHACWPSTQVQHKSQSYIV